MVNRCVCFNKRFVELKKIARRKEASTFSQLQQHAVFGRNCQRCRPYVNKMLATGETVFDVMDEAEAAYWERQG